MTNVAAKVCAQVFGEDQMITEEIKEFTKTAMLDLRTRLELHGLFCLKSCMEAHVESDPREIHVHGELSELFVVYFEPRMRLCTTLIASLS